MLSPGLRKGRLGPLRRGSCCSCSQLWKLSEGSGCMRAMFGPTTIRLPTASRVPKHKAFWRNMSSVRSRSRRCSWGLSTKVGLEGPSFGMEWTMEIRLQPYSWGSEGIQRDPFPLKEGLVCAEIGEAGPYEIELVSKGLIVQRHTLEEASRRECAPERYVCLFHPGGRGEVATAARFAELAARWEPEGVWVDSITSHGPRAAARILKDAGWHTRVFQVSGRTLQDQCWWKRWILIAVPAEKRLPPAPCLTLDAEPATPPLHTYPTEWLLEDKRVPAATWKNGRLKLDSAMPHLGQATPKPRGTLQTPEGRRHVGTLLNRSPNYIMGHGVMTIKSLFCCLGTVLMAPRRAPSRPGRPLGC